MILHISIHHYAFIAVTCLPPTSYQTPRRRSTRKRQHTATANEDTYYDRYYYDMPPLNNYNQLLQSNNEQDRRQHDLIPQLVMTTDDECRSTRNVYGVYALKRCCGITYYYTCNNMGILTKLDPYTTLNTLSLFYYNPHTHDVWLAHRDTHAPHYLQEQLLSPQMIHQQLMHALIAPHHTIVL